MRIPAPAQRPRPEAVVPMINVVFLLLVFFLMTSRLAPAPPVPITPPQARAEQHAVSPEVLFIAADGTLAFGDARGEAALETVAALPADARLSVTADAALPAADLARLIARIGGRAVDLTVRQ